MSGSKQDRQDKIIELITGNEIETQDELNEMLIDSGYSVTQATISRDIRELKLIKSSGAKDKSKLVYAVFSKNDSPVNEYGYGKSRRFLQDGIVSMQCAANILVIKTLSGLAMGVAASVDALEEPDIVGTIAGDDTIFCVVRSNKRGVLLMKKINSIIKNI